VEKWVSMDGQRGNHGVPPPCVLVKVLATVRRN
jgi:hypothetical protein